MRSRLFLLIVLLAGLAGALVHLYRHRQERPPLFVPELSLRLLRIPPPVFAAYLAGAWLALFGLAAAVMLPGCSGAYLDEKRGALGMLVIGLVLLTRRPPARPRRQGERGSVRVPLRLAALLGLVFWAFVIFRPGCGWGTQEVQSNPPCMLGPDGSKICGSSERAIRAWQQGQGHGQQGDGR